MRGVALLLGRPFCPFGHIDFPGWLVFACLGQPASYDCYEVAQTITYTYSRQLRIGLLSPTHCPYHSSSRGVGYFCGDGSPFALGTRLLPLSLRRSSRDCDYYAAGCLQGIQRSGFRSSAAIVTASFLFRYTPCLFVTCPIRCRHRAKFKKSNKINRLHYTL